jgi:hypothetical protein
METLLLQSESKKDMKMMADLAQKIGLKAYLLNKNDMEDMALAEAMKKSRTGKYVNTTAYLKKLKGI